MRHALVYAALLTGAVGGAGGAAGCTAVSERVATTPSSVCPTCSIETREVKLIGVRYERHLCPRCHTHYTLDESSGQRHLGAPYPEQVKVHVCDHCGVQVAECPQCRTNR